LYFRAAKPACAGLWSTPSTRRGQYQASQLLGDTALAYELRPVLALQFSDLRSLGCRALLLRSLYRCNRLPLPPDATCHVV
jgi:hypothetical protein